ncbi:MAG: sigma-70 family RNA polymerase sigma factor [Deltaproteobacteria bacterium]|nr:sigma-70 family RNA polymerase sigma factor [Deltaproteobacteria bacterium]
MALDVENLYRQFGPMVLRRCRRLLKDEGKALDAMQDTFVVMLRRQDTLTQEAPAGLLLKAATNVCLNRLRTEKRHPEHETDPDTVMLHHISGLGEGGDSESLSLGRRVLQRLFSGTPPSTQLIAVLHYVDRLTLEEVAAEVGLSVSGVRKRLRVLKERLPQEAATDLPASLVH